MKGLGRIDNPAVKSSLEGMTTFPSLSSGGRMSKAHKSLKTLSMSRSLSDNIIVPWDNNEQWIMCNMNSWTYAPSKTKEKCRVRCRVIYRLEISFRSEVFRRWKHLQMDIHLEHQVLREKETHFFIFTHIPAKHEYQWSSDVEIKMVGGIRYICINRRTFWYKHTIIRVIWNNTVRYTKGNDGPPSSVMR